VIEAYRAKLELEKADIHTQLVVANQVLPVERCSHPFFKKRSEMQKKHLADIEEKFAVPILEMPLFEQEVIGVERLRQAAQSVLRDCCCLAEK
jgi:arsenite-transporting ATPase